MLLFCWLVILLKVHFSSFLNKIKLYVLDSTETGFGKKMCSSFLLASCWILWMSLTEYFSDDFQSWQRRAVLQVCRQAVDTSCSEVWWSVCLCWFEKRTSHNAFLNTSLQSVLRVTCCLRRGRLACVKWCWGELWRKLLWSKPRLFPGAVLPSTQRQTSVCTTNNNTASKGVCVCVCVWDWPAATTDASPDENSCLTFGDQTITHWIPHIEVNTLASFPSFSSLTKKSQRLEAF